MIVSNSIVWPCTMDSRAYTTEIVPLVVAPRHSAYVDRPPSIYSQVWLQDVYTLVAISSNNTWCRLVASATDVLLQGHFLSLLTCHDR